MTDNGTGQPVTLTDTQQFSSPLANHWRTGGIRLVLPGLENDNSKHRLPSEHAYPLTNVIIDVLDEQASVSEVEILTFPGAAGQEHVITPKVDAERRAARNDPVQTGLPDFGDAAATGQLERARKHLAARAADYLPESVGIEHCELDLSPLGVSPLPMSRLVLRKNRETVATNFVKTNPMAWTIRQLERLRQPYMIQTLIRRSSNANTYLVSVRCAVIDSAATVTSRTDFGELLESGPAFDLASIWRDYGLTTNRELPIRDFWKVYYQTPVPKRRNYMELSDSYTARDLYVGQIEFEEFRRGRSGANALYEDIFGYPRFPVRSNALELFALFVPSYRASDLWTAGGPRRQPTINSQEVVRAAPGTDHALGTGSDAAPTGEPGVANAGKEGHVTLLAFTIQYYAEQDIDIWAIEQDGDSVPDAKLVQRGQEHAVEVESTNRSKPANLLANAARARYTDSPVVFIAGSEDHANAIFNVLKQPFKSRRDAGAVLYNATTPVAGRGDSQPVLPDGATEATWVLTSTGDLELHSGDRVVATGDAESPASTFAYDTPRYEVDGSVHRIVSATGAVLDTAKTRAGLMSDWSLIYEAHVPMDLHYLDETEIRYKAGNELREYTPMPAWDRDATGKRERYAGALAEFQRLYATERADAELKKDTFRETYQAWFDLNLHFGATGGTERLSAPGAKEFGVALPDEIDIKRRTEDDQYIQLLRDVTWLFPRGLVAPSLPFIDPDTDRERDAADDADPGPDSAAGDSDATDETTQPSDAD